MKIIHTIFFTSVVLISFSESVGMEEDKDRSEFQNQERISLEEYIKKITDKDSIKSLSLVAKRIVDLKPLEELKNLEELNLSYNDIGSVESLATLIKLKKLYLDWNKVKDISSLESLGLEVLSIKYNNIETLKSFRRLNSLKELDITGNPIKREGNEQDIVALKKTLSSFIYSLLSETDNDKKDIKQKPLQVNISGKNLELEEIRKKRIKELQQEKREKKKSEEPSQVESSEPRRSILFNRFNQPQEGLIPTDKQEEIVKSSNNDSSNAKPLPTTSRTFWNRLSNTWQSYKKWIVGGLGITTAATLYYVWGQKNKQQKASGQ